MKIFISCWHNNARNIRNIIIKDQWAVSGLFTEYGITKEIARLLPARYKGNDTLLFVPEWLSLVDRIKWINKRSVDWDIAIELHMNSWGWTGTEVFYWAWSSWMKKNAEIFSEKLSKWLNLKNRWAKPDTATRFWQLGFIRDTKPLAFLIELWFIDNSYDRKQVIDYWSSIIANILKEIYN